MVSLDIFGPNDVELLDEALVPQGVGENHRYRFRHKLYSGNISDPVEKNVYNGHNGVAALLYDPARDFLLFIQQFRIAAFLANNAGKDKRGIAPWSLEIVGGIIGEGEVAEDVICKEAIEESGCNIKKLESITRFMVSPGSSTEVIHLFCGCIDSREAAKYAGNVSEQEDIRVVLVAYEEAKTWLAAGRFSNAGAIISLLWFEQNRSNLRKFWSD